ncbi:hypothetical protein GCM10028819_42800 [Spirosoma humi]
MANDAVAQSKHLFTLLNELPDPTISPVEGGTNVFTLQLSSSISFLKLKDTLLQKFNMATPGARPDCTQVLLVNDSIVGWSNETIVAAFKEALALSKV